MKRSLILCMCIATWSLACSTTPKVDDDVTTESSSTSEAALTPMLDIHEMTITDPDRGALVRVDADGKLMSLENGPGPEGHFLTMTPGGTITSPEGELLYTLSPDGSLTATDGSAMTVVIGEDGACSGKGMMSGLAFNDSGNIMLGDIELVIEHVGGADNARSRRASAFAFIVMTTHGLKAMQKRLEDIEKEIDDMDHDEMDELDGEALDEELEDEFGDDEK